MDGKATEKFGSACGENRVAGIFGRLSVTI